MKVAIIGCFCQFLTERKQKIGVDELFGQWKIQVVDHSKQYDGNSCGVYTLTFAERYLKGESLKFTWTDDDLKTQRVKIGVNLISAASRLFTGPIHTENVVEEQNIPRMEDECTDLADKNDPYDVIEVDEDSIALNGAPSGETSGIISDIRREENTVNQIDDQFSEGKCSHLNVDDIKSTVHKATSNTSSEMFYQSEAPRESPVKRKTLRPLTKKRKRSSFEYWTPRKKSRKLYCICNKPDDKRLYWNCDGCGKWFHPACVGKSEDDEEEKYYCPSCEKADIEDLGSEEEPALCSVNSSRRISGKTALVAYPQVEQYLKEILSCDESNCEEREHKRHHEFCANPSEVMRIAKKKFNFGKHYFSQKAIEVLTEKLCDEMIYKIPDQKRPATSIATRMIRYVSKGRRMWKVFMYHKLMADDYLIHVLGKELLVLTASVVLGSPYEKCDEECTATEESRKKS